MKNYMFDFDGTLADSGDTAVFATQKTFNDFGLVEPSSDQIRGYMGIPIEKSFPLMGATKDLDAMFTTFRQNYQALEADNVKLYPKIKEVLAELKARDKQIYAVSSKHSEALRRNLELLGIAIYFDDLVGSDQVDQYKPAPDGIELLLKRYALSKRETVMIGDAIYDIQMGQAAGVKTAGVFWGAFDWEAVLEQKPTFALATVEQLLTL